MTTFRLDADSVHSPPPPVPFDVRAQGLARELGEDLAGRLFEAVPTDRPDDVVLSMLGQAPTVLGPLQARVEVVRTKAGCAVVRMAPADDGSTPCPCDLVAGFLEALPRVAYGVAGSLIENTCVRRGARTCLFTLLWDAGDPVRPAQLVDPAPARRALMAPAPVEDPAVTEPEPSSPPPAAPERSTRKSRRAARRQAKAARRQAHAARRQAKATRAPTPELADASVVALPPAPTEAMPSRPDVAADTDTGPDHATAPAPAYAGETGDPEADREGDGVHETSIRARQSPARLGRRSRRPHVPVWLKRRGWLLVLAMVAGVAGGTYAATHAVVSYSAQSTLVVQSGASAIGPGGAAEAGQLAVTYATVIPTDTAILDQAAKQLGITEQTLSSRLTVSVETGTAVFVIDYKAPTSTEAVAGSAEVARVVGGAGVSSTAFPTGAVSSSTIPTGTVSVVNLATSASATGSMAKYGKALGAILGLVVGLILALAAERADPRVDTAADLAAAVGSPASLVPDDLSPSELSRAIALEPSGANGVTVVPLARKDAVLSESLAAQLGSAWPLRTGEAPVGVSPPFETYPAADADGSGPTVLVVSAGDTVRRTTAAAGRLQAVHRAPVWGVLVTRRARRELLAGDR